ncbi:c-type cytochrome [Lewinella cohaerens]|uniref:c-type cytochrome n=1 Tax=Lewinella cohaerens TaxID=70995 RepID=UPI00036C972D|nr:cytochrome c [Lewinella cohaerens]
MKHTLVFLLIATFIYACGGSDSANETSGAQEATTATPQVDGKKIYKQYCVTCHGLYGDMGASGAFNLTTSELPVDERIVVITKGRGAMTPFENLLDADEIAAVAAYTLELKK